MKNYKLFILSIFAIWQTYAQETPKNNISVEEKLIGIQLGDISLSGFYEAKLANNWTLKGEMGLRGSLTVVIGGDNDFYTRPEIALSPRFITI